MNTTAEKVADGLADLLRAAFGRRGDVEVSVAPDPAAGLDLLAGGRPNGFSAVVFYTGDAPEDPGGPHGDTLVRARLTVGVAGHPGLSAQDSRRAPAALALAGEARAAVAAADPEGVMGGYAYAGMEYARDGQGSVLRGYLLNFEAVYAFELPGGDAGDAE